MGRLWATQRVGWLSAERRKNGASTELDSEIRELGTRWGIPTELTSYLVLEPGMAIPQATTGGIGRTGRVQPLGRGDISGAGAASPAPPPTAFEAARQAADMRSSRSVAESEQKLDGRRERRTADRMFTLQDSVWTDTRAAAAQARAVRVRPYSAAYFALMERHAELREILALGERVEVHGRAVTLVLAPDGLERLDAQALAAFTRDW